VSVGLWALAQEIADALPAEVEEVVLTGSVARGAEDALSDIEMLVVTHERLTWETCAGFARDAGLTGLGTWGPPGGASARVSGTRDGVPLELVWQARADTEAAIDALFTGAPSGLADALAHGVALRGGALLADWQARLAEYPEALVVQHCEAAALTWGGFAAAGMLTLTRPDDRLALMERLVDDAGRVLAIVWAVNRVWPPTSKRLADRTAGLARVPGRLADRITEALTEPDPVRALQVMNGVQAEAVTLAPAGPNTERARAWLAEVAGVLARA
jgi:hypothetical protein